MTTSRKADLSRQRKTAQGRISLDDSRKRSSQEDLCKSRASSRLALTVNRFFRSTAPSSKSRRASKSLKALSMPLALPRGEGSTRRHSFIRLRWSTRRRPGVSVQTRVSIDDGHRKKGVSRSLCRSVSSDRISILQACNVGAGESLISSNEEATASLAWYSSSHYPCRLPKLRLAGCPDQLQF